MGIDGSKSFSYKASSVGTRSAYATLCSCVSSYRADETGEPGKIKYNRIADAQIPRTTDDNTDVDSSSNG